jgi:hypothetical protein
MDTTKILAFRHPSQAALLLESWVQTRDRVPGHASRVTVLSDLPAVLQRITIRGAKQKLGWVAWRKDNAIWFFTAQLVSAPLANVRRPGVQINGYDEKGRLTECGVWVDVPRRGWQRCAL